MRKGREEIAEAWLQVQKGWWAWESLDEMCHQDPESAWRVIRLIAERADAEALRGLGAGPLEGLIEEHGPRFIDQIEAAASEHPEFAVALTNVWLSHIERPDTSRYVKLGCRVVPIEEAG